MEIISFITHILSNINYFCLNNLVFLFVFFNLKPLVRARPRPFLRPPFLPWSFFVIFGNLGFFLVFIGALGAEVGWVDTCDCGVVGIGCPTNDGGPWNAGVGGVGGSGVVGVVDGVVGGVVGGVGPCCALGLTFLFIIIANKKIHRSKNQPYIFESVNGLKLIFLH